MDRNKKIAIGCGGAGCLGLILIVIVCVVLLSTGYITMPGSSNSNRNENFNATNTNSNTNSNLNENTNSNSSTSSSSLSDDDKHKLFQAAGMTRDNALIQKVLRKIGLLTRDNDLSDDYASFTKEHIEWAKSNTTFIQSVLTPEKARAYVDEHMND
jgi:hypothetical protein